MKNVLTTSGFILLFIFILAAGYAFSQQPKVKSYNPPVPFTDNVSEWDTDRLVSQGEPQGTISGVYRNSDSALYVAVPAPAPGVGVDIFRSLDNGLTWSTEATSNFDPIVKTKMVISSHDSVYCFMLVGTRMFCWNVLNGTITFIDSSYSDFDVAASHSTGAMYLFLDSTSRYIPRCASTDGGVTWPIRASISSNGAKPRVYMSPGDSLMLTFRYKQFGNPDSSDALVESIRYIEHAPGIISAGGSHTVLNPITPVFESTPVIYNNTVWVFYSQQSGFSRRLKCRISTNGGNSYTDSSEIQIPSPNLSRVMQIDAKHNYVLPSGGTDIIFTCVTVSGGLSSRLYQTSASIEHPGNFALLQQISEHQPVSTKPPCLIEYYNSVYDAGAVWVGLDGIDRNVYFDRYINPLFLKLSINFQACPSIDTINVELRSTIPPYNLIETERGLGGAEFPEPFKFYAAANGVPYYIVVKHRNSIETWSKQGGESFTLDELNFDFTTAASQAYGDNQILSNNRYSIYTGDVQQDGVVDATDLSLIDNDAANFVTGYVPTDLNCDDVVDGSDAVFCDNNARNFVMKITP